MGSHPVQATFKILGKKFFQPQIDILVWIIESFDHSLIELLLLGFEKIKYESGDRLFTIFTQGR